MKRKILIIINLLLIFLFFTNCASTNAQKIECKNNYVLKPENSYVEMYLQLDENQNLRSIDLKDANQNFSFMLNLLEDGNCSFKIDTTLYDQTVNTDISDNNNKYVSQYIIINNKIYLIQEIDKAGTIFSQTKSE